MLSKLTTAFGAVALAAALACAAPAAAQGADTGMAGMDMSNADSDAMVMTGALGRYSMTREASGTSWQPDATPMDGRMLHAEGWMVMTHALLNGVYDRQGGPRGGDKSFVNGMVMLMASRPLADGSMVGFKAMLSPEPPMGASGYPLLLASGESADGKTLLVDRQHPHDLFMELSASYSRPVGDNANVVVYAGLPGEPAFGPPAFMHRVSGLDIPEAPITHHWLDSTHITFGVVTAGVVTGAVKFEGSVFNGREPDEHRWNIETGSLTSWAARASWNPSPNWSVQASTAHLKSPEALEPGVNQDRLSASAIYTLPFGDGRLWSTTLAWGRKDLNPGPKLDAYLLESAVILRQHWTLFGRAEWAEQNELVPGGAVHDVGKASVGAIYDVKLPRQWKIGLGGLVSAYRIPAALKPVYGSPTSNMVFVRLKLS